MSVVSVKEIWNGRAGSEDDKAERTYTRVYRVITNSTFTSSLSVRYALGIPKRFDVYADADGTMDAGAFVKSVKEHQTDDPYVWEVAVEYSSVLEHPAEGGEDPLSRPSEIKWGTTKFTKPAEMTADDLDISGGLALPIVIAPTAILNSADCIFDPPPEFEDFRLTLSITRNEAAFDPIKIGGFIGTVNLKSFFGFDPREVRCTGISAERVYEKGIFYWKVSYEFEIRAGEGVTAWQSNILDRGYMEYDGPALVAIVDNLLKPVPEPALLDGEGQALVKGDDPVFLHFTIYSPMDFDLLYLP